MTAARYMRGFVGVPGIHSHGKNSTDEFLNLIRPFGYDTSDPALPSRWALTVIFWRRRDARLVANSLRHGDGMVCHSYGCLRGLDGVKRFQKRNPGEYVRFILLIAPAMEPDYDFEGIDPRTRIVCLHSDGDLAIKAGNALWWHPFGEAGNVGFDHARIEHIDCTPNDHNDYFNSDQIDQWVQLSHGFMQAAQP